MNRFQYLDKINELIDSALNELPAIEFDIMIDRLKEVVKDMED